MSGTQNSERCGFLKRSGAWASSGNAQFVYVLSAGLVVKVGRATDILRRIKALQGGCPNEITPVLAVGPFDKPTAASIETELLRAMRSRRTHGEWFSCTVEQATTLIVSYCMMFVCAGFHVFDGRHKNTVMACLDLERTARGRPDDEQVRLACDRSSQILSCFKD